MSALTTQPTDSNMSRDMLLALIDADPNQPRQHFGQTTLDELATSLAENGQVVPIMVRPSEDRFTIVHGERRWRAARQLGWETIRAEVREMDTDTAHWLALTENIQRADLSPIEEARVFQQRLGEDMTQRELGERIGKSQSYIAQKLRLLKLPEAIRLYVDRGLLSEGHARQLLRLEGLYYGKRTSLPGVGTWVTAHDGDPDRSLVELLVAFRPEDQPDGYFPMIRALKASPDPLTDAARAFCDLVDRDGEGMALWTLSAYWWATFAVVLRVSVADLTRAIDHWRQRIWTAVFWLAINTHERPSAHAAPGVQRLWWSHHSDLRHAGLVREIDDKHFVSRMVDEWASGGSLSFPDTLPSSMQPWGTQADWGRALASGPLWGASVDDEDDADDEVAG